MLGKLNKVQHFLGEDMFLLYLIQLCVFSLCVHINQHPCSHRGRCVPGGDCGPPTTLQTPPDEDQSSASLGRAVLPQRDVSLCVHY